MNGNSSNVWMIILYAAMALGLAWLILNLPSQQGNLAVESERLEVAYVSRTHQFMLRPPASWSVAEATEGLAMTMANSAAGLARFNDGLIQMGDVGVSVGLIPMAFFSPDLLGPTSVQLDGPPETLLESILPLMRLAGDKERKSLAGAPWRMTLSNGIQAGMLTIASAGREVTVLAYPIAEGVLVLVTAAGYPGEDQAPQMALAIAGELDFIGSAEEVARAYFAN